jgi:hypothetical protein
MCDTCGCNITPGDEHLIQAGGKLAVTDERREAVTVLESLLSENDHRAAHNREHFDHHGVLAVNLMSSPGAGKTRLLEATIEAIKDRFSMAVIEQGSGDSILNSHPSPRTSRGRLQSLAWVWDRASVVVVCADGEPQAA